jgi:hypothetical protein
MRVFETSVAVHGFRCASWGSDAAPRRLREERHSYDISFARRILWRASSIRRHQVWYCVPYGVDDGDEVCATH